MINITRQGLEKPHKIEAHAGMYEQMARYLVSEEALLMEIKATLAHNNQSHVQLCAISYQERNKTR